MVDGQLHRTPASAGHVVDLLERLHGQRRVRLVVQPVNLAADVLIADQPDEGDDRPAAPCRYRRRHRRRIEWLLADAEPGGPIHSLSVYRAPEMVERSVPAAEPGRVLQRPG